MLNISTQQYTAWLADPSYQNYLRRRAEKAFASTDPIAYNKLIQAVDGGDLSAIKLFFEMRGIYNPRVDVNVNLEGVLQRVIEVVSRHVSPETLAEIADELEGLTGQPARLESAVEISSRELPTTTSSTVLGF